jgi:hypothetical protein
MKILEQGDPEEASLLATAMDVGRALEKEYPNHPWIVAFQGGALVVKHMAISDEWKAATGKEGMCFLLPRDKIGTASEVRYSALQAGGQMLEAFGLRRGAWTGERPKAPRHMVLAAIKSNHRQLH